NVLMYPIGMSPPEMNSDLSSTIISGHIFHQHNFVDNFIIEQLFHRLRLKPWHLITRSDNLLVVHKDLNKGFLMNFTHRITVLPKYLTVVLVLVLGAALTGCTQSQDDDDAPADLQETSEVEEYIPASADGPAQ